MTEPQTSGRGLFAILLSLGLGAALVVGLSSGAAAGAPEIADGAVAVVDGEDPIQLTREQFDATAERLVGSRKLPKENSSQYEELVDAAMSQALQELWFPAEAEEQDVVVSDQEIEDKLVEIQRVSFGQDPEKAARAFNEALVGGSFCTEEELADQGPAGCPEARRQATLVVLQERLLPATNLAGETQSDPVKLEEFKATIPDEEVETFYAENPDRFAQPATRDARVVLNEDEAKAQKAFDLLSGDSSGESWQQVARRFSEDEASKDRGGLLEGLIEGQGEPERDEEIFSAETGELVGPFETERGFYVIQVAEITEAGTQPLDDALEDQIRDTIASQIQTEAIAEQEALTAKWTARTTCAEGYVVDLCSNFVEPEPEPVPGQAEVPPDPCTGLQADQVEPPAVAPTRPIAPGTALSEASAIAQGESGLGVDPVTGQPLTSAGSPFNGAQQGSIQGPIPSTVENCMVPAEGAAPVPLPPPGIPPGASPPAPPPASAP